MKNKEYQTIVKMIEYIDRAVYYTKDMTFDMYSNDIKTIDATVFVISQIGELIKNFDNNFQKEYPNIKWHILKGLRNRIVHDYEGIQTNLIWSIIKKDLLPLRIELQEIIDSKK